MICTTQKYTVGKFMTNWATFELNPPYQRQANVWSSAKKASLLETLFLKLDIPKFYLHKIPNAAAFDYAVVDGKQRLSTIWSFYQSKLALPSISLPPRRDYPKDPLREGMFYKDLSDAWKDWFQCIELDVVIIETEGPEDEIEDMFERLNNGQPLNSAEKRNAKTGPLSDLIRELVDNDEFFATPGLTPPKTSQYLAFGNIRYAYNELVTKLIFLSLNDCDPEKTINTKSLDNLLEKGNELSVDEVNKIAADVRKGLRRLQRVFRNNGDFLTKAMVHIYFITVTRLFEDYAHPDIEARMMKAFFDFEQKRVRESLNEEETIDALVAKFNQHVQQNTGSSSNMSPLVDVLMNVVVESNPDFLLKDKKRDFNPQERRAIWILGGKKCAICGCELRKLSDMHADHVIAHANGGETSIKNAQSLCAEHNLRKSAR